VYREAVGKVEKMPDKLKGIGVTIGKIQTTITPE